MHTTSLTAKLLLFAAFVGSMLLMSLNYRKRRTKIVFLGDSITVQGAVYGGYIPLIKSLMQEAAVEDDYELTASGVDDDQVYDLYLRLDDVLYGGPDVGVILIGTNDVWHKWTTLTGTSIDGFEIFYLSVIQKLLAAGIKVVLCTPCGIGENVVADSRENRELEEYCGVIRRLAVTHQLLLADTRKAFVEYNLANNPLNLDKGILTLDGVHLNRRGNELVAGEIWQVLKDLKKE